MIIIMRPGTTRQEAEEILNQIESVGLKPLYMPGTERTVLGAIGDERKLASLHIENHPGVDRIAPVLTPYKLVSRECHPANTLVNLSGVIVGGKRFTVIAGPCAVESPDQMVMTARAVRDNGAHCLRGGAYKPRSSPYSFQGLGEEGLKILRDASKKNRASLCDRGYRNRGCFSCGTVCGCLSGRREEYAEFPALEGTGKSRKPVILKRGMSATAEDLLLAAEYVVSEGNPQVILCERGIRTFETATRNTLNLNAIPYLKQHSHLPVIVDPSHGTGVREYVTPMAKAAAACGADGVLIEVHHNPKAALSDGHQSLDPAQFSRFMDELRPFVEAAGKEL